MSDAKYGELAEVQEGRAKLLVTPGNTPRGPGTHVGGVFYNPAMALARDLSVLVTAAWEGRSVERALDGLAGAGARGIRWLVETNVPEVAFNDLNPVSIAAIERNLASNGVADRAHITRKNLGALLWEGQWDAIDIDPFGSPAPFLSTAARAIRHGGVIGFAATDTAALTGASPKAGRRRYGAHPGHGECMHEIGLRILAGFAARQAALHDVAVTPVLAHSTDHYMRVYAEVWKGAARADEALKRIGYSWQCGKCIARGVVHEKPESCTHCGVGRDGLRIAGPLWIGGLNDGALAARVLARPELESVNHPTAARTLLETLVGEADTPALFYDLHETASSLGLGSPPARDAFIARLRAAGFAASTTHTLGWGMKTDASVDEIARLIRE